MHLVITEAMESEEVKSLPIVRVQISAASGLSYLENQGVIQKTNS